LNLGWRHAAAGVTHDELDTPAVGAPHHQVDRTAELSEFDRVRQQVEKNLRQTRGVGVQVKHVLSDIGRQPKQTGYGAILDEGDGAVDERPRVDHFLMELQLTSVDARQIEQIVDDVQEMLAALPNETDIFGLA